MSDFAKNLPALCVELRLREEAGVALVNSRDVAEFFKKRHADVLRDIERLLADADLRSSARRAYC